VDSFAAYAYTCRIFNAYPVANNRVDKPQKNYPCETYIAFSVIKMYSNTSESQKIISWLVDLPLKTVGNVIINNKLETSGRSSSSENMAGAGRGEDGIMV